MIKVITKRTYLTSSGESFDDQQEAIEAERRYQLRVFFERERVGKGGEWSQEMFFNFVWENRFEILELLGGDICAQ